jgi:hypothetical protein
MGEVAGLLWGAGRHHHGQRAVDAARAGVLDRSCAKHTSLTASLARLVHDPLEMI